jgi:hypothetical protein
MCILVCYKERDEYISVDDLIERQANVSDIKLHKILTDNGWMPSVIASVIVSYACSKWMTFVMKNCHGITCVIVPYASFFSHDLFNNIFIDLRLRSLTLLNILLTNGVYSNYVACNSVHQVDKLYRDYYTIPCLKFHEVSYHFFDRVANRNRLNKELHFQTIAHIKDLVLLNKHDPLMLAHINVLMKVLYLFYVPKK